MSYALVFGGLVAVVECIGGIAGLVYWICRPVPRARRGSSEPLALFSHAHASLWAREDEDEAVGGAAADLTAARLADGELNRKTEPIRGVAATPGARRDPAAPPRVPERGG